MEEGKSKIPIHTIGWHYRTHADEILARMFLREFPEGEEYFPGVSTSKTIYIGGENNPDDKSADELEQEGILLLGRGGGRFDEHPSKTCARKSNESCASLVAKYLGLYDRPEMKQVIYEVTQEDLKGAESILSFPYLIKTRYEVGEGTAEETISWSEDVLRMLLRDQYVFVHETGPRYRESAQEYWVSTKYNTESVKVVAIDNCTDARMNKYARFRFGGGAGLVIIRSPRGNVQIFPNKRFKLPMEDIVRTIRVVEQQLCFDGEIHTDDWKTLEREGVIPGVDHWFYFKSGKMFLNGSLTSPNVTPTTLDFDTLVSLVLGVLEENSFYDEYESQCQKGVCVSSPENQCPWYSFGLKKCRTIRYEQSQQRRS